jgi:hypothetical protein
LSSKDSVNQGVVKRIAKQLSRNVVNVIIKSLPGRNKLRVHPLRETGGLAL